LKITITNTGVKNIFVSFVLTIGFTSLKAQLNWVNVSTQFAPLPPSVQVFMSTDSIEGKANKCFYVKANLKDKSLDFTTRVGNGKRFTPQQYFEQEGKPLLVVNGTFFSFADNRNLNLVIHEGKLLSYNIPSVKGKNDTLYTYVTRSAIGINKKRKADVAWLYTDTTKRYPLEFSAPVSSLKGQWADPGWRKMKSNRFNSPYTISRPWKMQTAIGGGPALLKDGEIWVTNKQEIMFVTGEADRHPRTAMGYTADNHLIILMTEGRNPGIAEGMTLTQQAEVLKSLGCIEALNLDGGGSSSLIINGKETIKPSDKEGQRPVPAVFMIFARQP
jgi:hypothetical protein